MHCSSLHCLKLNLKSAYLQGKLHITKKCITSSKNTRRCIPQKCIASRNLTKIAYLKYFQTWFKSPILHTSSVHSSRVYCSFSTLLKSGWITVHQIHTDTNFSCTFAPFEIIAVPGDGWIGEWKEFCSKVPVWSITTRPNY